MEYKNGIYDQDGKKSSPPDMPELKKELKSDKDKKDKVDAGAEDEDLGDEGPYAGRTVKE